MRGLLPVPPHSSRLAWRISDSACFSRESSLGFQRVSISILCGLQRGQERRFRLSRLRMVGDACQYVLPGLKPARRRAWSGTANGVLLLTITVMLVPV